MFNQDVSIYLSIMYKYIKYINKKTKHWSSLHFMDQKTVQRIGFFIVPAEKCYYHHMRYYILLFMKFYWIEFRNKNGKDIFHNVLSEYILSNLWWSSFLVTWYHIKIIVL